MTKTSRLGESLSPRRESSSPKPTRPSPGREFALKMRNSLAISLRRTSLAWARAYVAQNPFTSLERDARMAIGYATLLIPPRRAKLAWARIADFLTDRALNSLQPWPIRTTNHTKQISSIPKHFIQVTTSHWHTINS